MKLTIHTQYRENYAAHDEGYVHGVDSPAWKYKGGSTYVVPNFRDYKNITEVMKTLDDLICYGNGGSEEYILDWQIVDDSAPDGSESWETITQIFMNEDKVTALKITDNRPDEDGYAGYMRSEILEKTEAWTMLPESERSEYNVSFLMKDGDICDTTDELQTWFEAA